MGKLRWLRAPASKHTAVLSLLLSAVVAAAAAETSLRWQNSGQLAPNGSAAAIAAEGGMVVAGGTVCTAFSVVSCRWFVRAIDAATGGTVWEDRVNVQGARIQSVVVHQNRAFAGGVIGSAFVVRAYDLRSGARLWEKIINDPFGNVEIAEVVGASGNRVFAVGGVVRQVNAAHDYAVFAFDVDTGELVWENISNPSALRQFDIVTALDTRGDQLFTAGPINNFSAILVRAFDAHTGRVLWEEQIPGGTHLVSARQLVTHGDMLFVAGGVQTGGDQDLIVRAYDQVSGAVRWTHVEDGGGNDEVFALEVSGNRLFAAGNDGCNAALLGCSFAVRHLDAHSGAVIWRDVVQEAPGGDAYSSTLTSSGGRVYAGGAIQDAEGVYQWALRSYDAATGAVFSDERIGESTLIRLERMGNTIYAAGVIGRPDGGSDFAVRAYSSGGH